MQSSVSSQGTSWSNLVEKYDTPLYVYQGEVIHSQVEKLRTALKVPALKIKFAAKALTNLSILRLMKKFGLGVDVVSMEEGRLAIHAGFTPAEIMFTPSGVDTRELRAAALAGFQINLDSLPALAWAGQELGNQRPISIRLNPNILAGGNYKISTGHKASKFGIPLEQLDQVRAILDKYSLQVNGLHIHTGSEISDVQVYRQTAQLLFSLASSFPQLTFLDFGSGFKVAYKPGDEETDLVAVGEILAAEYESFRKETGRALEIWIEPGKFLVSEAGTLITRVNVVKENPEITFVGINSGLNHLIRPMMYQAHHEIVNLSNPGGPLRKYTVTGYICETDTFGSDRMLTEVREGDYLAILHAGAYGYSMASNYNSRLRPAEVLVFHGQDYLIRQREKWEDLLRNQPDPEF